MKKGLLSHDSRELAVGQGERAHKRANGQCPTEKVRYAPDARLTFQTNRQELRGAKIRLSRGSTRRLSGLQGESTDHETSRVDRRRNRRNRIVGRPSRQGSVRSRRG